MYNVISFCLGVDIIMQMYYVGIRALSVRTLRRPSVPLPAKHE